MVEPSEISKGDKEFYDARTDSTYVDLCCAFHAGKQVVGSSPGIDKDTNAVIEIPELSEDVGFQPDCPGCRSQAILTIEHINAVESHDRLAKQLHGMASRYGVSPGERVAEWDS